MAGAERGNWIERGVELTKPLDIAAILAGVVLASSPLLVGGVIGLMGGELIKDKFGSKK